MSQQLSDFIANHLMLVGILVALIVALIGNEYSMLTRKYKALNPAQLTQLINRDSALVIDVSPIAEFQAAHIVGARHVAMSQFDPENKELAKVKDLPVAVVCKTGQTAAQACARLVKAGFTKVYWLDGGLDAWRSAEMPLTKGR